MSRFFEWLVGWRYTRAKRRNRFVSFIALIATAGIALGVAALITVLAVMNGFQRELRSRILGVTPHIEIMGQTDGKPARLTDWRALADRAARELPIVAVAPYIVEQGMLTAANAVRGVKVRGVFPADEARASDIGRHFLAGKIDDLVAGEFGIVLGMDVARGLGVRFGDRVTLIAPQGLVTPAGIVPRLKQFVVKGVFEVGMFEFDAGLALIHFEDAQRLYRTAGAASGVRLRVADVFDAAAVAKLAMTRFANTTTTDWTRTHATFFRAVQMEKTVMFLILTLLVAVAAFNIVSTLVMAVADKRSDIAILRTLGASPSAIQRIFMVQGGLIGVAGVAIGTVLGLLLAANLDTVVPAIERLVGTMLFDPTVYYITTLPSELRVFDVTIIVLVSLALTLIATLYPSYRAARTQPAAALRYE